MAQLHFYVPDDVAAEIRRRAESMGMTTSRYVAELVSRELAGEWPLGYFDNVIGSWEGEPLERPDQGALEEREPRELL